MTLNLLCSHHIPLSRHSSSIKLQFPHTCIFFHHHYSVKLPFSPSELSLRAAPPNSFGDPPEKGRVLDEELVSVVSAAKDADEALCMIGERTNRISGVVGCGDCCLILSAAVARGNADLALSIFYAMRSSFDSEVGENGNLVGRWKWSRPDVNTYTVLIQSLASSMRVSDALRIISSVCRVGVSPNEEVPFGKVVRCPSCMVAVAVAQPQHGIQIVSCSKCRYQFELVSGTISSIESEEIRISCYRTQHGCPSMEERAEDFADCEAKFSSRGSLCCS